MTVALKRRPMPAAGRSGSVSRISWVGGCSLIPAIAILLFLLVALQSQLDQPLNQLWVFYSGSRPQLGVHADRGEARHGIDLIEIYLAGLGVHQEVHAGQAGAVHCLERSDCHFLQLFHLLSGELCRDDEIRTFVQILGVVVVYLGCRYYLARYRRLW